MPQVQSKRQEECIKGMHGVPQHQKRRSTNNLPSTMSEEPDEGGNQPICICINSIQMAKTQTLIFSMHIKSAHNHHFYYPNFRQLTFQKKN